MISTTDLAEHTLEQVRSYVNSLKSPESYSDAFLFLLQIEPIRNLFAALFLASIGMLINVHFLWTHVDILLASVILVIIIKTTIVTTVVKGFGYNNKTALLVKDSFSNYILVINFSFVVLPASQDLKLN